MLEKSARYAALLALGLTAPLAAHGPDSRSESRTADVQTRLDRETQKVGQRAEEQAARFAEERARIMDRAAKDPSKAAEDLAKLDADVAKDQQRTSEDLAKAQEDFTKDSAKAAEDAAKDTAASESRSEDRSDKGSSAQLRDLADSEGADHDADGFPVRKGELIGVDLGPAALQNAEASGFKVIAREPVESLGREVIRLSVPVGMGVEEARSRLQAFDPAAVVDLVHYYGLNLTAGSKGHKLHGGSMASSGSSALAVGVIDTAISPHLALGSARLVPWSAGSLPGAPVAHGTAVASILAAQGRATIYSANIFRGPADRPFTSADVIAQALDWMLKQGVPTINMSLAGPRNAVLDRLIRDAVSGGRTVVAAAGNGGPSAPPAYPAAVPGVVAVTAVDKDNRIYRYANRGRYITLAARGVDVIAANAAGGFARFSGTSFATPQVAGWLARCRSGGASSADCQAQLRRHTHDAGASGFDDTYGWGVLD